ncbi:hypothetical protein CVT26_003046 [Gymnopilus dilepis]|uniref:F-box domain-containing protein n=1 Tax=Gymnopilus dilepis TaxID=231916 RepID=A0A409Y517_9AGAR|nr:hypothetical protein CVT26_003046 [Gymnopilus dilepis]
MSLAVTDADISDLCARGNWANLRDLWLPPSVDGESPSLASLHNLASHCPKLRSVGIPIDFRLDFDSPKKPRHRPRRKHKLEHLTIFKLSPSGNGRHEESGTTIRTAIAVARFLEYHFPFLRSGLLKGDGPNSEWWTTVHLLIAEYQSIRAEERQEAKISGD